MQRAVLTAALFLALASVGYAHGGSVHVKGTVTQITAATLTVQTTAKKTDTIKLNDKTMFMKSGKHVTMNDLKVGDRVVVEVSEKDHVAESVTFGAAPAAAKNEAQAHAHK